MIDSVPVFRISWPTTVFWFSADVFASCFCEHYEQFERSLWQGKPNQNLHMKGCVQNLFFRKIGRNKRIQPMTYSPCFACGFWFNGIDTSSVMCIFMSFLQWEGVRGSRPTEVFPPPEVRRGSFLVLHYVKFLSYPRYRNPLEPNSLDFCLFPCSVFVVCFF